MINSFTIHRNSFKKEDTSKETSFIKVVFGSDK